MSHHSNYIHKRLDGAGDGEALHGPLVRGHILRKPMVGISSLAWVTLLLRLP